CLGEQREEPRSGQSGARRPVPGERIVQVGDGIVGTALEYGCPALQGRTDGALVGEALLRRDGGGAFQIEQCWLVFPAEQTDERSREMREDERERVSERFGEHECVLDAAQGLIWDST